MEESILSWLREVYRIRQIWIQVPDLPKCQLCYIRHLWHYLSLRNLNLKMQLMAHRDIMSKSINNIFKDFA